MRPASFRRFGAALLLCLSAVLPVPSRAQPSRVISFNLCTDQLLLALADRSTIASVTNLARDCTISAQCRRAADVPINYGTAEEMIAAKPDLVLAGRYTTRPAIEIARRMGLKIIDLDPAKSFDMVRTQIREVAAALGQVQRGEAMVADLDRRLALPPPPPGTRPVAAVYQANGMTVGAGTLIDAVMEAAGFADLARNLGFQSYTYLPLEVLIASKPDILIVNNPRATYPSLAESILRHPAIAAAIPPDRRIVIPQSLWICGGAETGEAVSLLEQARQRLAAAPP